MARRPWFTAVLLCSLAFVEAAAPAPGESDVRTKAEEKVGAGNLGEAANILEAGAARVTALGDSVQARTRQRYFAGQDAPMELARAGDEPVDQILVRIAQARRSGDTHSLVDELSRISRRNSLNSSACGSTSDLLRWL